MDRSFSPPLRRRSSFFKQRESIGRRSETEIDNINKVQTLSNDDHEKYLSLLEKEQSDWKELYLESKKRTRGLKRKLDEKTNFDILKEDTLDTIIPDNIKDFLKKKPDIHSIIEESFIFHQNFEITLNIYDKLVRNNKILKMHLNLNANKITSHILHKNHEMFRPKQQ